MSDKIEKLVEDIQRLTKSISQGNHNSAVLEAKTAKVLDKMVQLETLCQSTIPELRAQLKARDKEIRKMKKNMQEEKSEKTSLEIKVKELSDKKEKRKKSEKQFTPKEEKNLRQEKLEKKYQQSRQQVQEKKEKIQNLERRVTCLEEQNRQLKEQNLEKDLLIRSLSWQNQNQSLSIDDTFESSSMAPSRGVMSMTENQFSQQEVEVESLKGGDDAETDDEFDDQSDQDLYSELQKTEKLIKSCSNESEPPVQINEEVKKMEQVEGSAKEEQQKVEEVSGVTKVLKKVFWFMQ